MVRDMKNRDIENKVKKELDDLDEEEREQKRQELSIINKQIKLSDLKGLKE